jgi:hypothetical protein
VTVSRVQCVVAACDSRYGVTRDVEGQGGILRVITIKNEKSYYFKVAT